MNKKNDLIRMPTSKTTSPRSPNSTTTLNTGTDLSHLTLSSASKIGCRDQKEIIRVRWAELSFSISAQPTKVSIWLHELSQFTACQHQRILLEKTTKLIETHTYDYSNLSAIAKTLSSFRNRLAYMLLKSITYQLTLNTENKQTLSKSEFLDLMTSLEKIRLPATEIRKNIEKEERHQNALKTLNTFFTLMRIQFEELISIETSFSPSDIEGVFNILSRFSGTATTSKFCKTLKKYQEQKNQLPTPNHSSPSLPCQGKEEAEGFTAPLDSLLSGSHDSNEE